MSGTVSPGSYTTLIPDTGLSLVTSMQVPSPTMPVISSDLQALAQLLINNDVVLNWSSSSVTIDGTGDVTVTIGGRFTFVRVTGSGSGSDSFQLDWTTSLPSNSILFLMNAGSGALIVRRAGGSLVNTLYPGDLGVYRHDQTATDPLAVVSQYTHPHTVLYTDDVAHTINGIYKDQTVIARGDLIGATSVTYSITGGVIGNKIRVVNSGFPDGVTLTYGGSPVTAAIPQNGVQDLTFDGTTWSVSGFCSALHG